MIKLLLDQGLPYSTARFLPKNNWDVVHLIDVGMQRASDREVIEYARTQGRLCVTLDSDFHQLLALTQASSPSVLRIRREGLSGADVAGLILSCYPRIAAKLSQSHAMVTITERAIRIRYLPLPGIGG